MTQERRKGELHFYRLYYSNGNNEGMIFSRGGVVVFIRDIEDDKYAVGFSFCSMSDEWKIKDGVMKAMGRSMSEDQAYEFVKSSDGILRHAGTPLKYVVEDKFMHLMVRHNHLKEFKRRELVLKLHKVVKTGNRKERA